MSARAVSGRTGAGPARVLVGPERGQLAVAAACRVRRLRVP